MGLYLPTGAKPAEQESQHWYSRDGRPAYDQPTKGGGLRPTDLRDARKLGLVPSVTTALSVLSKPALETWKVKQGILAALTLPRNSGEPDDAYLARVLTDSREQAKAAAEEGTRIHDACEAWMQGRFGHEHRAYKLHVDAVRDELERLFPGVTDWVAEASFAHTMGYGGKVDLHSPSTGIVVDYKGKDGDFTDGKKLAYDQHYQLAAYNRGLLLPPAECANVFVSRTHPGKVASHKWSRQDIDDGWEVFDSALRLWKCLRRFDSSFTEQSEAA